MLKTLTVLLLALFVCSIAAQAQSLDEHGLCDTHPQLCTEKQNNVDYEGNYVGHDEPSLLFYSNKNGSGNSNLYFITLPKDPSTFPNQAGTAGTANFQLHPAFWFGMAMCDSQSSPNFTSACNRDTDANIFDNPNPLAADYIGHHPGVAFMEMQFYPPGWVLWPAGNSCDASKWCAALNIDSLSEKVGATGTFETDLPAIEGSACNRTTGAGCTNPPVTGSFYPIYTTIASEGQEGCVWQEGGALIPHTINSFGGTSTTEYGPLLLLTYPLGAAPGSFSRYEDYRQVLNNNPCKTSKHLIEEIGGEDDDN